MIEKGRISAFQMAVLMYPTIFSTAILLLPRITGKYAAHDLWLSPIWASAAGFLAVFLVYRLHRLYPGQTFIQQCETILGPIPGKLVGFAYLFYFLHITAIILREYGEFVVGTFLRLTPLLAVIACMVFVCTAAVRGGIEVLGRTAEVFGPAVTLLLIFILLLLLPELRPEYALPIMENGIVPSLKGAVVPMIWFSEFWLVAYFFPFLADPDQGLRWGMIAVVIVLVSMIITNLATLMVFGELMQHLTYPVIAAAGYITVGGFVEHLESIVMAVWVAGTFLKVSTFYYAFSLSTAQWLKLNDYRPVVLPLGFLLVLFAFWVSPNLIQLSHSIGTTLPFYFFIFQLLIPAVLLLIAHLRRRGRPRRHPETAGTDRAATRV